MSLRLIGYGKSVLSGKGSREHRRLERKGLELNIEKSECIE